MFLNRARELSVLEQRWQSSRAELIVVYGRRRVGKTELPLRFAAEKPYFHLVGERSRQGIYRIIDNYLAFWFRFVLPNESYLQQGRPADVLAERVIPALPGYVGPRFEDVCRQFLLRQRGTPRVPVDFDTIGAWWSGADEIDVVGLRNGEFVLVGECKWTNEWVKIGDLNELRRKAAIAGVPSAARLALFSRSGFDPNLVEVARSEEVLLYGLNDLFAQ